MTTRMMRVMPRRGRIRPAPSPAELRRVPIDQIDVPPRRLRRDLGDIDSLAASLGTFGQLAPVVCYTGADGRLRLIAGERRLEATRRLHAARGSAPEIDVLVRTLAPNQAPVELELIENAQRRELSDAEEADAFIQLTSQLGRRLQAVADISGRSVAYVSKRIRLFEDAELRAAIEAGEIATSQAEELLALPESVRGELLARSISQEWSRAACACTTRTTISPIPGDRRRQWSCSTVRPKARACGTRGCLFSPGMTASFVLTAAASDSRRCHRLSSRTAWTAWPTTWSIFSTA